MDLKSKLAQAKAQNWPSKSFTIPDVGEVLLKCLPLGELDEYNQARWREQDAKKTNRNARALLIAKCLFDPETGERVYSDSEVSEVSAMPSRIFNRIAAECQKLCGMFESVDDAEKNSEAAPNES